MKPSNGAILALVLLATCSEEARDPSPASVESSVAALGVSPPTEIATWQKAGSTTTPEGRYLQAAAWDETRKVVVMFGGEIWDATTYTATPTDETWEWSPATGKWALRSSGGASPNARSGAAMVFDSKRNKLVMFGGRSGSGLNLEDTWELDGATGVWTNVSAAGTHPSARSQHGMVYETSTGKIFLFGGGRSDTYSSDGTGVTVSMGDAWELDPATNIWTSLPTAGGPSMRHDFGMVWDSLRSRVVLFGGMQTEIPNASGVPKQDTWEYDPATLAWTERTLAGNKPSQRYAHGMTFDGSRGQVVVFGGWDISTGYLLNDLWDWDPTAGTFTQRVANGATSGPQGHLYPAMFDIGARIEILAGAINNDPYGKGGYGGTYLPPPIGTYYGIIGSREIWELDPATATYLDRTVPLDVPSARSNHAMAYYPDTGKTYLFGGYQGMTSTALNDLWQWDGATWAEVATTNRPSARGDAALAYDPARKSLILFGGTSYYGSDVSAETWEWTPAGGWTQLKTSGSPDGLYGHGMVTDTGRGTILLFGGMSSYYVYYGPDGGMGSAPMKEPMRNEVWEWNGAKLMWTNRTPTTSSLMPVARQYPTMAFDSARQKLFLYDGYNYNYNTGSSTTAFWEWDSTSGGWALRDPNEWLASTSYNTLAVYDSIRRREIIFTDTALYTSGANETWEVDARGPTWYVRTPAASPGPRSNAAMAFDSARGVAVLFGGINNSTGYWTDETWEYRVSNWGNGEGCTAAFAKTCASGNCVDGVCCDSAACTGPCQSCNVLGSEGSCLPVKAGTEVAGSCSNGQACDGNGKCMSSNGQPCASGATCASGSCADGVCCDTACGGTCVSCNATGSLGKCTPYAAGSNPQKECGKGTGLCRSTCDGVGSCVFPGSAQPCASCTVCDGMGTCGQFDPYCSFAGAGGGGLGGTGGYVTGGSGGYTTVRGGSGGYTTVRGGAGGAGGYTTGGTTTVRGGAGGAGGYTTGGTTTVRGGAGGSGGYTTGGTTTVRGGAGGSGGFAAGGTTTVRGGAGGSGGFTTSLAGAGGRTDGGAGTTSFNPDAGDDSITLARLHRSGCSCDVGQGQASPAAGLALPFFFMAGTALLIRSRRRRR